jgi:RNA polymerase sigma-70 factor (ECF subfamily)
MRIQAGDREAFAMLYMRYFDRVYGYVRMVLGDAAQAEDITQQVFIEALQWLPRYEYRGSPFRAWLFTVARNQTMNQLKRQRRIDVVEPAQAGRLIDASAVREETDEILDWISDRELQLFVERLPLAQRQVLALVYLMGLTTSEAAQVLVAAPRPCASSSRARWPSCARA